MKIKKNGVVIIVTEMLDYTNAPGSRALSLKKELSDRGIDVVCIGGASESQKYDDSVIAIRPFIKNKSPIYGSNLNRSIFQIQLALNTLRILKGDKFKYFIIRRFRMFFIIPLVIIPFLKLFKKKIIYDFHGWSDKEMHIELQSLKDAFHAKVWSHWLCLKFSDHIIAVSKGISMSLRDDWQKKTIILENGVDLQLFKVETKENDIKNIMDKYNIPLNKKIIGFIGNEREAYDIDNLVESSKYLDHEVMIVVVGESKRNNKDNILFLKKIPHNDVITLLNDVFYACIMPYNGNWFGAKIQNFWSARKVKEYLASGKPIIMSDIRGRGDFLTKNINVLLYQPNNPKDIANKIRLLVKDKKLYEKMCSNNLILSERFSWNAVVKRSGILDLIKN
jgi:glycosyltransferase involved in cell wall biosynthesis